MKKIYLMEGQIIYDTKGRKYRINKRDSLLKESMVDEIGGDIYAEDDYFEDDFNDADYFENDFVDLVDPIYDYGAEYEDLYDDVYDGLDDENIAAGMYRDPSDKGRLKKGDNFVGYEDYTYLAPDYEDNYYKASSRNSRNRGIKEASGKDLDKLHDRLSKIMKGNTSAKGLIALGFSADPSSNNESKVLPTLKNRLNLKVTEEDLYEILDELGVKSLADVVKSWVKKTGNSLEDLKPKQKESLSRKKPRRRYLKK